MNPLSSDLGKTTATLLNAGSLNCSPASSNQFARMICPAVVEQAVEKKEKSKDFLTPHASP
jgi:hypothetical protein